MNDPGQWQEELEAVSEKLKEISNKLRDLRYDDELSAVELRSEIWGLDSEVATAADIITQCKNAARFAINILKGLS